MKSIKKGIAALLAAALVMQNLPAAAAENAGALNALEAAEAEETAAAEEAAQTPVLKEEAAGTETAAEEAETEMTKEDIKTEMTKEDVKTETAKEEAKTEAEETKTKAETETAEGIAAQASSETMSGTEAAGETLEAENPADTAVITFNTGSGACALSEGSFSADGSYTIEIPELNPFFPYEVQFAYDGKTENRWFMTPDDKVTAGGHDFYVRAEFDGTAVTRMSLDVAGKTVVIYPAEKDFADDGISAYSLLPLEEKSLTADLTGFTPVELTMVKISSIFAGENAIKDTDSVVWTYQPYDDYSDDYAITQSGGVADLSYGTYSGTTSNWEMIVGAADQLEIKNIRYDIRIKYSNSYNWLLSDAYKQDDKGVRTSVRNVREYYDDEWGYNHDSILRREYLYVSSNDLAGASAVYVSMKVNDKIFNSVNYGSIKAFEGTYTKISEIKADKDITDKLFCKDMASKDAGYLMNVGYDGRKWITFVTYDASGNTTGCMPFELSCYLSSNSLLRYEMKSGTETVEYSSTYSTKDGYQMYTCELYKEYPADGQYTQELYYRKEDGKESNGSITAAYAGKYNSIAEAADAGAKDIKAELFGKGYTADYSQTVYFSIFAGEDTDEKQEIYHQAYTTVTGETSKNKVSRDTMKSGTETVEYGSTYSTKDGYQMYTCDLYREYPADGQYTQSLDYYKNGVSSNSSITAAYVGKYNSIAEAAAAGAKDIKAELFGDGYTADYSKTVYFSIFAGEDTDEKQEIYHQAYTTVTGETSKIQLSSTTFVTFNGLKNAKGTNVPCYIAGHDLDSYSAFSYLTIFVDKDTDITNLAPEFKVDDKKINLYADDGKKQESGKSLHDFSKGPVQYTATAENGKNSRNYWLQILKAQESEGQIYINSFNDPNAGKKVENGVIYAKREMIIDAYHNNRHDILVANIGLGEIKELKAELKSDTLELDEYWTLKGVYSLSGLGTIDKTTRYGELPNLAKIRINAKSTVAQGSKISGTLTIKSGNTNLAVLNLTGTYGSPQIITNDIPQAVKFVPYGSVIQNNNKYPWNTVTYELADGKLPVGMVLKENGEIYGVPCETGEFKFSVRMKNSAFNNSSAKQFTLTVAENSDENVDNATDEGYDVTKRISNVSLNNKKDQLFVSKGEFGEFTNIFIDGTKLEPEKDYVAESGSTRITIKAETIGRQGKGKHTLGVEFRAKEDESLKRAAQNFSVGKSSSGGGSSSGGDSQSSESAFSPSPGTASASVNKANVNVTAANVMEETADGMTYCSIALPSDAALLKLSFFNKVYGDNEKLLAYLNNGVGYSLDINEFLAAGKDLNLTCMKENLEGFAQGFQTICLSTAEKTQLGYDLSVNMVAGTEYVGHTAYVFILDEDKKGFLPYIQTAVAPIGNVAFTTKRMTDFIVMIAQ